MRVFRRFPAAALVATALASTPAALGKLETWRQESASAFAKGKKEGVVVSDAGRVRLGRAVKATAPLDAARAWDLARTPAGVLYVATGDAGQVFRREGDGPWTVAHDAEDTQVLSLAALPDGRVFAGTGPSGQVVEVSDAKVPSSRPDPGVQYIWDLAAGPDGSLYAATGPTGQLWKRDAKGTWSLVLDAAQAHLLSVAVGPGGEVYAGTDGEGLIYRVSPEGKAGVLYDAPQADVRTLLVAPDGTLYAGTASESGSGGSGRGGGGPPFTGGGSVSGTSHSTTRTAARVVRVALAPQDADAAKGKSDGPRRGGPAGGTAAPKPASPGENAVYRFGPEGVAREVFRAKVLIHSLAWADDRLLVGTGPEGTLYEVRDERGESSPLARIDHGQILGLLADSGGVVRIAAGDPGAVLTLEPGFVPSGTLVSEVLDAKLPSRFGAVGWRAEVPEGTSVALQVRTGQVGEPNATWSDWSPAQSDPEAAVAGSPPGRFAQYRLTLATKDPSRTPEVRSVAIRYQSANLAPEIAKLDVPDLTAGDGATRQDKLTLRWEAADPNGDDLAFTLALRKESWPDWVRIGGDLPITESRLEWDASSVPDGLYRLRLSAADRPSNPPGQALESERVSDPFVVDHGAPTVEVAYDAGSKTAKVTLRDGLTRVARAAYSLDGGTWVPAFPDDGLFDTRREAIGLPLPDLKPGTHVLMVRAHDAAGNVGAGDVVFEVR